MPLTTTRSPEARPHISHPNASNRKHQLAVLSPSPPQAPAVLPQPPPVPQDQRCELLVCCNTNTQGRERLSAVSDTYRAAACNGVACGMFTLWASDSFDAVPLMQGFYQELQADGKADKAVALARSARRLLQDHRDSPLMWAGAVVSGWTAAIY